mgnify:CR=1 FL=1
MSRKKLAIIGGGQIGGTLALLAVQKELGDVIIFDIPKAEGMVQGKTLDIMQLRPHDGYDSEITGTSDWNDVNDDDGMADAAQEMNRYQLPESGGRLHSGPEGVEPQRFLFRISFDRRIIRFKLA